jgi:hypothetical protein
MPDLADSNLSAGAKLLLEKFVTEDWPGLFRIHLSAAQKTEIEKFLHGFLIYHLGKLPRGRHEAILGDN